MTFAQRIQLDGLVYLRHPNSLEITMLCNGRREDKWKFVTEQRFEQVWNELASAAALMNGSETEIK